MKRSTRRWLSCAAACGPLALSFAVASCSSDDGGSGGSGGSGGTAGMAGAGGYPVPGPGEQCFDPDPAVVRLRFHAKYIAVAPGETREVELIADPDFCLPEQISFSIDDDTVADAPEPVTVDLRTPSFQIPITGKAAGSATLTASIPRGDGTDATADIPIEVLPKEIPACAGSGSGRVDAGQAISGNQGLSLASVGLQEGATKPNEGSFLWGVQPFDATIACADDQVPGGFDRIGPAVTFGPVDLELPREIPLSLPINPAAMPEGARLRHVTVSYTGPKVAEPRAVAITDPRIIRDGDGYKLTFMVPWLGTYQAIVKSDAGTVTRTRKLTYRSVVGVSMGGGGTSMVGLRHHQRFDVIAPLGGPVDWTYMLGHIERNHVSGWLSHDGQTLPTELAPMPEPQFAYEHPSQFNRWWYEYPKNGNGGSFPRAEYVQIFRDLALMFGNPMSQNSTPGAENLPAGVPIDHPTVVGNRSDRSCAVWVDPLEGPDEDKQRELDQNCPAERCAETLRLENYYDAEFNPTGSFPVITVCDGSAQDSSLSPYANTFDPDDANNKPLELGLAVDYDDDGVRDPDEPIIVQGHETYRDVGPDGLASEQEPGYQAGVNEDPAGDDYHPRYNPGGTEGNYRWDEGEPYDDFGLDGVPNTAQFGYDVGEGDGKYTLSNGYRTFLERDSRTVVAQLPEGTHDEPLDDDALARIDTWTDGGLRDLFNFHVAATTYAGAFGARGRVVHYYSGTQFLPGQDPTNENSFIAGNIPWEDVPGAVVHRYGKIDPSEKDINNGSGQHVGTADEITRRLQVALYYIGSRWPNPELRTLDEAAQLDPDPNAEACEVNGACDLEFTDSRGRSGPVSVNLPPGYANAKNQDKRYPVVFLLHGYGQTPEDLKAAIIFLTNWMNSPADASRTRLPKAIMVYVDGRCRPGSSSDGEAECIRGTFFTDSVREKGPKMESWWIEMMDFIDQRFRTLAPAEVEWTE